MPGCGQLRAGGTAQPMWCGLRGGGGVVPAVRRPGWMRGGCRVPLPAPPKPEEERCSNPVCRCPAVRLARSSAGCALRFAAGQTKPSNGSSPSLRCTFPLFGSRWSIPQHNSHHAPGSGSQPLTWVFPSHLLENRLQAAWLLLLCSNHHRGLVG